MEFIITKVVDFDIKCGCSKDLLGKIAVTHNNTTNYFNTIEQANDYIKKNTIKINK